VYIPIIVLAAVFVLIAIRQVGRYNLKIWQIMLGGAIVVLLTGQISIPEALHAVNMDVMLFLFGMFIVGEAMVESGYLSMLSRRFFSHARTPGQVILFILFGIGLLSALIMNDTLAIIGTPLVLGLATKFRLSPKLMLLSLAIAVTTGSVMSPIGNPQNLLIAVDSGMQAPFVTFGLYLLIPTLISLAAAYFFLWYYFRPEFSARMPDHEIALPGTKTAFFPVQCSLAILLILAVVNIIVSLSGGKLPVPLPLIALCAAAPVILLGPDRVKLLKNIDWFTLVFFAAMFVLMESVWQTGFFQSFVDESMVTSILMALAAGSTIAGNLMVLGAASNVIIIQNAEKQGETLTFLEFARIGVPLTVVQLVVYWAWLTLMPM
jgi:Na+/H+ antiporter NhaD/arsenite permease-like protein